MTTSIHTQRVLVLNKQWQAISIISAAEAFGQLMSGTADALNIVGSDTMEPVDWDAWLSLPIREGEEVTETPHRAVKIPRVLVLKSYAQMPMFKPKFCLKNVYLRDKGVCQYSGKSLKPSQASIDHVIPLSRGGPTTWENCVLAERNLNSCKGDRTPSEAGLKLLNKPFEPRAIPVVLTLKNPTNIPEWDYFLQKEVA